MRTKATALAGLVLLSLAFPPVQAEAQEGVREPVPHTSVISGNPLILLAGWFNAEYERKIAGNMTAGISGGWLDLDDDDDYTNVSGFLRFYPQEAAFTGFYFGGRSGVYNVDGGEDSTTSFGIGVDIGYTWLLGPSRAFYVGLGIGVTRLFGGDLDDFSTIVPSVRLVNIGIAF
jgi:hypothetical protein